MERETTGYTINKFFLLRHLIVSGANIETIIREQYYLAKLANIPISDSNQIPDWERVMMLSFLMKDIKTEKDGYDSV